MFVCYCRTVTDRTVRRAISDGASTLGAIADRCGAGSRCGGCHVVLERMLADAGLAPEPAATAAAAGARKDFCAA